MANLIKKIQNFAFQEDLFQKGDKLILAVSGGSDSVFMLDVFCRLQKKYDLELLIVHVNYGLRGRDSQKDEELVQVLAKKYQLPLEILRPKIKGKFNLENRLRDIRYQFFQETRKAHKYDAIAVAHNLNDQVETFLMRLLRGSGLLGLSAMQPKSERIIRPLLFLEKKEIEKYLKENKLKWRLDKTNREDVFLRNKIRNKLIPYLERNFNPKFQRTVFDSLGSIAEDVDFLENFARKTKVVKKKSELSVKRLLAIHPAIQRRILRQWIFLAKGNLTGIDAAHIEEILKIIKSTKNKSQIVVIAGLKIQRKGDKLEIDCFK